MKGNNREIQRREQEIRDLVKKQKADMNDRKVRFEHAVSRD